MDLERIKNLGEGRLWNDTVLGYYRLERTEHDGTGFDNGDGEGPLHEGLRYYSLGAGTYKRHDDADDDDDDSQG